MLGLPEWAWGILGGLVLGPLGLLILWPGCSRGAQALLLRFVVSVLVKLFIAVIGLLVAIKFLHLNPKPLVYGFLSGYVVSMFLEIIPCIRKVRRCATEASQAD